jgi:hypothetical protein
MALPAIDAFTGTNNASLSASWTAAIGTFIIRTNAAAPSTNDTENYAFWNADAFGASQYAKIVLGSLASGDRYRGVIVRASGATSTFNGYVAFTDGVSGAGHTEIGKIVSGVYSSLKAVATTFIDTDVFELRATGTSTTALALFKGASQVDTVSDSSTPHTSGAAGIYAYNRDLDLICIDSFEGGNLAGGSGGVKRPVSAIGSGGMSDMTGGMQGRARNRIVVPAQLRSRELQRHGAFHELRV